MGLAYILERTKNWANCVQSVIQQVAYHILAPALNHNGDTEQLEFRES